MTKSDLCRRVFATAYLRFLTVPPGEPLQLQVQSRTAGQRWGIFPKEIMIMDIVSRKLSNCVHGLGQGGLVGYVEGVENLVDPFLLGGVM